MRDDHDVYAEFEYHDAKLEHPSLTTRPVDDPFGDREVDDPFGDREPRPS